MTQAERDRLVALKKAKKKLITQKQAAEEIGVTERQVRRLLRKLRRKGDQAVIHELRGRASNRKVSAELEQRAVAVLSDPLYRGFGPTLAAEYLHKQHRDYGEQGDAAAWMVRRRVYGKPAIAWWRCTNGGRGGAAVANWCSGTPAPTTGWKGAAKDLSDLDDRRCHQPAIGALRAARHQRGEHAPAVGVSGAVRPAAGVLHG
jgi:biotin operon repressor